MSDHFEQKRDSNGHNDYNSSDLRNLNQSPISDYSKNNFDTKVIIETNKRLKIKIVDLVRTIQVVQENNEKL